MWPKGVAQRVCVDEEGCLSVPPAWVDLFFFSSFSSFARPGRDGVVGTGGQSPVATGSPAHGTNVGGVG